MHDMMQRRAADPAFHPDAPQRILDLPAGLFGVERGRHAPVRIVVNLTDQETTFEIDNHRQSIGPFETHWAARDL